MQIKVLHYTFTLSEPYQPGHQLTLGEAQALNSLRTDQIRAKGARLVARAQVPFGQGQILPQPILDSVRSSISQLDLAFEFKPHPTVSPPTPKPGTLEAAIWEVASIELELEAAKSGFPPPSQAQIAARAC
jgi:hypothetical protein